MEDISKVRVQNDPVTSVGVYLNGMDNLKRLNDFLKWHEKKSDSETIEYLTLGEIYEQISRKLLDRTPCIITVCENDPSRCRVYQHGNHPCAGWEELGEIRGYA